MSESINTRFQEFCSTHDFHFLTLDHGAYIAPFNGQHGKWTVFCHIDGTWLSVFSVLPVTVPPEKRRQVLDFLNQANWQIRVGAFELDPDGSEVRLRTSLDCADCVPTTHMLGKVLFGNLIICDRFLPGLLRVLLQTAHETSSADVHTDDDAAEAEDTDALNDLLRDVDLDQLPDQNDP